MAREINKENYPNYFDVMDALKKTSILWCLISVVVGYFCEWSNMIPVLIMGFVFILFVWYAARRILFHFIFLEENETTNNQGKNKKTNNSVTSEISESSRLSIDFVINESSYNRISKEGEETNQTKSIKKIDDDVIITFRVSNPEISLNLIPHEK